MDILKEKWDQILQTVKVEHELSDISFKTWLQPLQLHEITDTTVTILVPNEQMAIDYISKKYTFPLKVAIAECTGKEYNIEFILPEQAAAQLEAKKKVAAVNNVDNSVLAERAGLNPNIRLTLLSSETTTNLRTLPLWQWRNLREKCTIHSSSTEAPDLEKHI